MIKKFDNVMLDAFLRWLKYDGVCFFQMCMEEYGTVLCTWAESYTSPRGSIHNIPHPVHFREGMQVRNWMRKWYKEKDKATFFIASMVVNWYDDNWETLVTMALTRCRGRVDEN